jgi:hypothetical protein
VQTGVVFSNRAVRKNVLHRILAAVVYKAARGRDPRI